jgi:hypothetical protein
MKTQKTQPLKRRYFIGKNEVTKEDDRSYMDVNRQIGYKMLEASGIKEKTHIPYGDIALSGALTLTGLLTSPLWLPTFATCSSLERGVSPDSRLAKGITTARNYAELGMSLIGAPMYAMEGFHTHYDISKTNIDEKNGNAKLHFIQNNIHRDSKKLSSLEILLPQGLVLTYGHKGHYLAVDHDIRFDTPFEEQDDSHSEFPEEYNQRKIHDFKTSMVPIRMYEGLEEDIEKLREFSR